MTTSRSSLIDAIDRLNAAGLLREAWRPGMRFYRVSQGGLHEYVSRAEHRPTGPSKEIEIDTDDSATVGGLLSLLREATCWSKLYVYPNAATMMWHVIDSKQDVGMLATGSTEGEAVANAITEWASR